MLWQHDFCRIVGQLCLTLTRCPTDIDECPGKCPSNAACTNTPGGYFCTCNTGYAINNGQLDFTDQEVECKGEQTVCWTPLGRSVSPGSSGLLDILKFFADIDECFQDPSRCGPNSVCTNVPGSYSCSCLVGFHPNPEGSLDFTCKSNNPLVCLSNGIWVLLCSV